jgi:hypothetical protein
MFEYCMEELFGLKKKGRGGVSSDMLPLRAACLTLCTAIWIGWLFLAYGLDRMDDTTYTTCCFSEYHDKYSVSTL